MENTLQAAFNYHRRNLLSARVGKRPAFQAQLQRDLDLRMGGAAARAIAEARRDVAAGTERYIGRHAWQKPYPAATWQPDSAGLAYVDHPENAGLRLVGRVSPDFRRGPFNGNPAEGWVTDPYGITCRDGTGLCCGVVYQLPARKGCARFVAGYQFGGGDDDGAMLDLSRVYTSLSARGDDCSPVDHEDARDAACAADSMAQKAAEDEREYQTAWAAGSQWAQEQEAIREARQEALAILAERRAVKGESAYPALCKAIRSQVQSLLRTIAKSRAEAAKLASGDVEGLGFWNGDARLHAVFCEAAGLESFPC